jgi:hypothetical protein
VDTSGGEECEDGNEVAGDGCTVCMFDCSEDADCDDTETCNGTETCDTTAHTCAAGTVEADGTACTQASSSAGVCRGGLCVAAGCGNSVQDAGEDCDDGNQDGGDGCENDCTFTCKEDGQCDDADLCTGTETCDTTTHTCTAGTAVTCTVPSDASAGCTVQCDAATGECLFADVDGDGVGCDADCVDSDPLVYPGAVECNDSKDNDCDGTPDNDPTDCVCYEDVDGDGYAVVGAAIKTQPPPCPKGYTEINPDANEDCQDQRVNAFPGQTAWFTNWYCKTGPPGGLCLGSNQTYDYNCNTTIEKQYTTLENCNWKSTPSGLTACVGAGWTIPPIPECGKEAYWSDCINNFGNCMPKSTPYMRKQGCH